MRHPFRAVLPLLLLAGCSDLISPPRIEPYEYRIFEGSGENVRALAFNWPRGELPVKFWVDPTSPLRPHLQTAIDRWEDVFLYGEWRGEIVADQAAADIAVFNERAPGKLRSSHMRLDALADQCTGAFDFELNDAATSILRPMQLYVWSRAGEGGAALETCYSITVTHEVGHSLGILAHSANPADVMYADPEVDGLSARDRATAEAMYHLPTTLGLGN